MDKPKAYTLRLTPQMHEKWLNDAKSQGVSLKDYITAGVQRDRIARNAPTDPVDMAMLASSIDEQRKELSEAMRMLGTLIENLSKKAYDQIDLARAKDCILGIMLDPENKDVVKTIVTREQLREYIVSRNKLLERYLVPTPEYPMTLLDEILFELESQHMIWFNKKDEIQWGLILWEKK